MMDALMISGNNLDVDAVVSVANGRLVQLDPLALPGIERSRRGVERLIAEGKVAYGITTGFGRFKDRVISADQAQALQFNLVRSHAAGTGPLLPETQVRAIMLVRANTLARGFSGVRPAVVEMLVEMLNRGVHPCIPCKGSLGASGDLAPLAHLALVVIGEGEAFYQGKRMPGAEALALAGLSPLELGPKEGLALLNGTAMMVGLGALLVRKAINLALTADIAACLSLEALHGTDRAYDPRVHELRPHPRQMDCAAFLRKILQGSKLLRKDDPNNVQDPYTLRCIPQVHGAIRDAIAYARWVINIELNSVNDNPMVFVTEDESQIEVISAGNFHGEPIAIAMDYLKLALTELANMSERRVARLVDADSNGNVLPMFLTEQGGLESGFMIAQYTAAALASENKVLAHPASADTIPTSANVEDHVSMGATAVQQVAQILENVETVVGIELLTAAQGVDFRLGRMGLTPEDLGEGTRVAYGIIREKISKVETDVYLAPLIEQARELVTSAVIKLAVEKQLGMP